MFPEIYLK